MSKTALEFALDRIRPDVDVDSLLPVFSHFATWIAEDERQALSACYDRVREVRRGIAHDTTQDACFRAMLMMLDTHLANREKIERFLRLTKEIEDTPLWRRILWTLAASPPHVSLEDLGKVIAAAIGSPVPPKELQIILENDLYVRELVEWFPDMNDVRVYALTHLGRKVCDATMPELPAQQP